MLDTLLRNGTIVDGTGAPPRRGDVGIRDGRIVELDRVTEPARRTIDADGLVVAPGFVDIHTHLDAQLFWDPLATPSTNHGFTTVVGGNCGFTFAPIEPDDIDYMTRLLSVVEGMPLDTLQSALPFDWSSFRDYLDRLEGRIGVNAGFLVGHSMLRRTVMKDRARGGAATPEDIAAMSALLDRSLRDGGLGFSSSWALSHIDHEGQPIPTRFAALDELVALATVAGQHQGTTLEFAPGIVFGERERDAMIEMSLAAGRPINWNVVQVRRESDRALIDSQLAASDVAAARGAQIVALTFPDATVSWHSMRTGVLYDKLPGWADVMHAPLPERMRLLRDPDVRARLEAGAREADEAFLRTLAGWDEQTVFSTLSPANDGLVGLTIGEIARRRGVTPFDAFIDISLEDELDAYVQLPCLDDLDPLWEMRLDVWRDGRTLIGGSDAGAHLDMLASQRYSTALLDKGVRQRHLLPIEEAVHMLTDAPARLYGLRGRGRLAEGYAADITLFDPERVGHGDMYARHDLPSGGTRIYVDANGIERVLVNGVEILVDDQPTGDLPGQVLRSQAQDTVRPG